MKYGKYLLAAAGILFAHSVFADVVIPMSMVTPKGQGASIGTITAQDTKYGLLLTPHLTGLAPGLHGFHIHVNPSCDNMGDAAGGHLDPQNTNQHLGPYGTGHLGDLPPLFVNKDGTASLPLLAPRLTLADLTGHSLMIHEFGDNYSDQPQKLGGGGPRVACGVIGTTK